MPLDAEFADPNWAAKAGDGRFDALSKDAGVGHARTITELDELNKNEEAGLGAVWDRM